MRLTTLYAVEGLISLLFTACQKDIARQFNVNPQLPGGAAGQKNTGAKADKLVLETFTHTDAVNGGRQYQFVYAPNGNLDSIVVSGNQVYVYRVVRKGARLDSVNLVQNGTIISTFRHFQSHGNQITGFNYFDRIHQALFPTGYTVTYDRQKRIPAIDRIFRNTVNSHQEFTYDASDNIIAGSEAGSLFLRSAAYTYDEELNPLHFVPDLFVVMVEEQWICEYAFSLHNSVSKTYSGGQTLTYQNQYNSSDQLVTKTFMDPNSNGLNTFAFTYR